MLTLDINEKYLILSRNAAIKVKWKNPAFFFDRIAADVALNIRLPFTEINRAILGNPERFEKYTTGTDRKFHRATLRYGGTMLVSGVLNIEDASGDYECWLQSDLGAMGEEQREKKITDMNWPTAQDFVHKTSYDDSTDDYGIQPLINQGFWEGKGREESIPFQYLDENGEPANGEDTRSVMQANAIDNYSSWINIYNLESILPGCVISPQLHLRYVLKKSLQLNKWFINRNDMIDAKYNISWLKNIKVYNTFGIIDVSIPGTISKKIKEWDPETREWVIYFVDQIENPGWTSVAKFDYKDLLPKVTYKNLLIGIQNTLNYIFRFRNDGKVDIIDRNEILNTESISLQKYHVGNLAPGNRKNVRLKFLPEYDKNDSKFSTNFEDLSDRYYDYKTPVDTYDDLALLADKTFGELRLVKDENKVYEYTWLVVADESDGTEAQVDAVGWKFASSGPQPYVYGTEDEVEEINSPISTLQQIGGVTPILEAFQKGNIRSMRSLYTDFGLRLLPGNMTLHSKSLYWEGDDGIFKNRWINWARWYKNRLDINTEFKMPVNRIFHTVENITSPFSTDEGEFLIEEMETEFKLYDVGNTSVKGYKK